MTTITEVRGDHRIFAGSDPAFTAVGHAVFGAATPALTPLMLDVDTGAMVAWDGANAGLAVAVLALDHDGVAEVCTYYKSGTFDISVILWPDGLDIIKKRNAFVGTSISVA